MHKRFIEREHLTERNSIIRVNGLFDDIRIFIKANDSLKKFSVGNAIVQVDTTDFNTVDFDKLVQMASDFISNAT